MEEVLHWIVTPPHGVDMVFWACTLIGTLIFLILTVMSFIGINGGDGDIDIGMDDVDGSDVNSFLPFFSVHSLVNFVMGFGWTGVAASSIITSKALLYLAAVVIGLVFAYMYIWLRKKMMKLESNGAYQIKDSIGKTADVYLRIPKAGEGKGKIQISINGSIHEIDAVSEGDAIPTGARVKIVSLDGNILTVKKI